MYGWGKEQERSKERGGQKVNRTFSVLFTVPFLQFELVFFFFFPLHPNCAINWGTAWKHLKAF